MKRESMKWLMMLALMLSIVLILSACSNANNGNDPGTTAPPVTDPADNNTNTDKETEPPAQEEPPVEEELEFVELKWYVGANGPLPDNATVNQRVNEILKEKINAHVEIIPIPFGEIKDRMLAVMASGEEYDLSWTGNWANNYAQNVNNGAYIPLDDLIAEYAPNLMETIPEFIFEATRMNGSIYGIPNYQTVTMREGFIIRKDLAEKYNLDVTKINNMADITPFLEQIKEGEPDIIPLVIASGGPIIGHAFGQEDIQSGVGIDLDGDPYKAIITIGSDKHMSKLNTVYEWQQKGLINSDAAELNSTNDLLSTGKVAVFTHNVLYPGSEQNFKNQIAGHDVVLAYLEEPWVSTNSIITTMNAISKTSKNPERAMMLINLVNTDKELYNTLVFGIEGKHFDFVSDGVVKVNTEAGYDTKGDWIYGNTFNRYLYEGENPADRQAIVDENFSAKPSPLMGFTFDRTPIDTERANISAIYDRYKAPMNTGMVPPEDIVPDFVADNMKAGIEKIQQEVQKQIDEWRAANGI